MFQIVPMKFVISFCAPCSDLNSEESVGRFYKKELQKTNQNELRVEKVIKRKLHKWKMLNGKTAIISLLVGLIKKIKCK